MDDEPTVIETEEPEETPGPVEETGSDVPAGRGPGFRLGLLFGLAAGALAAVLFAPSSGEEFRLRVAEDAAGGEGVTDARASSVLEKVRARVQQAAEEAHAAVAFAEAESRAHYEELTTPKE